MMGEEEPKTAIQRLMDEFRKQQKEVTWENVYEKLWSPSIKVSADIGSLKGDVGTVKILESTAIPSEPVFIPWCYPNPLKKFPEDGEIHINIKKHNIKFNFKN